MTSRRNVEFFHLVFLRALTARLEDKRLVALKGGTNLRFFLGSVRYSEGIDFDVAVIARTTLRKKIDALLSAPTVIAPLKSKRLRIVELSAPKQTETTQRWKLGLEDEEHEQLSRTRIEFSRRGRLEGARFEPVSAEVASSYGMPPFLAMHYPPDRAIVQKIHALQDRREPQPRDVFDLNHLFPLASNELELTAAEKSWIPAAIDHAISVSFDDYTAKVVAFLEPEQAELFAERPTWDLMQSSVIQRLESLLR